MAEKKEQKYKISVYKKKGSKEVSTFIIRGNEPMDDLFKKIGIRPWQRVIKIEKIGEDEFSDPGPVPPATGTKEDREYNENDENSDDVYDTGDGGYDDGYPKE